jgi:hypothetical protein
MEVSLRIRPPVEAPLPLVSMQLGVEWPSPSLWHVPLCASSVPPTVDHDTRPPAPAGCCMRSFLASCGSLSTRSTQHACALLQPTHFEHKCLSADHRCTKCGRDSKLQLNSAVLYSREYEQVQVGPSPQAGVVRVGLAWRGSHAASTLSRVASPCWEPTCTTASA